MKSYTFELKDVGCHFQTPKKDAPKQGSGGLIRVGKSDVPVTLRWIQPLKDDTICGLWYFPPKGMGRPLIEHRGEKAPITYPVELTPAQLGIKPKAAKAIEAKVAAETEAKASKAIPDAPKIETAPMVAPKIETKKEDVPKATEKAVEAKAAARVKKAIAKARIEHAATLLAADDPTSS